MKKNQKLAMMAAVMMAATALLSGCASKEPAGEVFQTATPIPAATQAEAQAPVIEQEAPAVPVLARVNGYDVKQTEVDQVAANLMSVYSSYGYDISSAEAAKMFRQVALNYVMEMTLLDIKADEWQIAGPEGEELAQLTAAQKAEFESVVTYYMENNLGVTASSTQEERSAARESALALLTAVGCTEQSMLDAAIRDARREKIQAELVKDITVSDEEIQAAYDSRVSEGEASWKADPVNYIASYEFTTLYSGGKAYYVPEGYRGVLQILLPVDLKLLEDYQTLSARLEEQVEKQMEGEAAATTAPEDLVTQEQVDAARETIIASVQATYDEIAAKLAAGTPFLDLVDEYNIDPGMKNADNRENGYSVHMDSVVYDPSFIQAAFSTHAIGEISRPTVGSYGAYVVYYLRDIPAGPVPMNDQLRSELLEALLSEREEQVMVDNMNQWISEAVIETTDAGSSYLAGN